MKIHKGDKVKILAGKDRGKTGRVLRIDAKKQLAVVEGLNLFKKHRRPTRQNQKGEVLNIEKPLPVSRIALFCSSCGKTVRIGYRFENEKKVRCCIKCKTII
jgi:large subunit ribosomal protein L24